MCVLDQVLRWVRSQKSVCSASKHERGKPVMVMGDACSIGNDASEKLYQCTTAPRGSISRANSRCQDSCALSLRLPEQGTRQIVDRDDVPTICRDVVPQVITARPLRVVAVCTLGGRIVVEDDSQHCAPQHYQVTG
mmetsp:Transcript_9152/g.10325  ORF Transcript_9152/g.10325 Transcript_9152/m.10325 type:complete len:136 (+) Transcript_9152:10-417(+)